jgi:hypothetical protein
MNLKSCKTQIIVVAVMLAMLCLATAGCSFTGISTSSEAIKVDVDVSQRDLDAGLAHLDLEVGYPHLDLEIGYPHMDFQFGYPVSHTLDVIKRVELMNGFIRYHGTKNGLPGSFDLSLEARNGGLQAEIISVDIPGASLNDRWVVIANQRLGRDYARTVIDSDEVYFEDVTVQKGSLHMTLTITVQF